MTRNASTRTASPSRRPASSPAAAPALALYEQVKHFIVRRIQDGSWRAGDRLPSESELVAQFGISRMTVNRALRELTEQGRIVRVAGVGSFVAEDKPQSTLLQIANLASEIRQRGHDYRCDVLAVRRAAATLEVAAALDLGTGASVFHTQCVHRENGVPVQLEDRHVNPALAPDFLAQASAAVPPSVGSGAWKAVTAGLTESAMARVTTNTVSVPSRWAKDSLSPLLLPRRTVTLCAAASPPPVVRVTRGLSAATPLVAPSGAKSVARRLATESTSEPTRAVSRRSTVVPGAADQVSPLRVKRKVPLRLIHSTDCTLSRLAWVISRLRQSRASRCTIEVID